MSKSPAPQAGPSTGPVNRHAPTPVERQRAQLDKLLKDPSKPAFVPTPLKEKIIRPPREMMKNVQGSSAGAGSGEFHVYKASRRREYERLKMMDEMSQKVGALKTIIEYGTYSLYLLRHRKQISRNSNGGRERESKKQKQKLRKIEPRGRRRKRGRRSRGREAVTMYLRQGTRGLHLKHPSRNGG